MEQKFLNKSVPLTGTLAAAILLVLLAIGAPRADAATTPFKIDFDQSKLDVSLLKNLPLDAVSSDASIEGTVSGSGYLSIPKGQFKMPEVGITAPVEVKAYMGIESDAIGEFDEATGRLDLDAQAAIWVSVDIAGALGLADTLGLDLSGQLGALGPLIGLLGDDLTCGFSPMDIHFTTESTSLGKGKRFVDGPLGTGAITAEWSKLGPFGGKTKILGIDACQTIQALLPGLLTSLGGNLGGIDLGSVLSGVDLSKVDLGPSAITLTRSLDEAPDPDPDPVRTAPRLKLKITPKSRRAKAGRTVRYRATVFNAGTRRARNVSVCIKAPKRPIRTRACRNFGSIAKKAAKGRNFVLHLKRKAASKKYRIRFNTRTAALTKPKRSASLRIR